MSGSRLISLVGVYVLILSSAAAGQPYGPPQVQRGRQVQGTGATHDCTKAAGNVVANCSFETGDFTNWVAVDISEPFFDLQVAGPTSVGFDFFTSVPTQGKVSALNGFDGAGPGTIELGQDLAVPEGGVLVFDYRGAWNLKDFGNPTQDRTFEVHVEPQGGGEPMHIELILTAEVGTVVTNTGLQTGVVDLSAFSGEDVRVNFVWTVPEDHTGPGFFELDNVQVTPSAWPPMALEVDFAPLPASDGNGVFEPGEEVEVAPAWRNDSPIAQMLDGEASDFTGPAGPDYVMVFDMASYGEVGVGSTASCRDEEQCYQMQVGPQGVPRPTAHWDATFQETLSVTTAPVKGWSLHIGDSFTDVPRENLFYTAIETLLHHGITGGCDTGEYCPAGINSRSQMAAFVLRAAEGPGYVPPDCVEGMEAFDDVSAASPFCPWIEELDRRDVVAGCGGGNYCPGDPVSRAQMAIFLLKTLEGAEYEPDTCTGEFTDVPCPSLFADWIEDLAARGITGGCTANTYCPGDPVSRAQMASLVTKSFGLVLYGP